MKLSNLNKPTEAKWVKIGTALISVSGFIATYALTQNNATVGFLGLGFGGIGTFIIAFK
jgi:hypothetical protein